MKRTEELCRWCYRGLWSVLTQWLRVPDQPPSLPALSGERVTVFQPDEGFLRYLLFHFWLALVLFDGVVLIVWLLITLAWPLVGLLLAVPALLIAVVPDIVAYVAVYLRFDTTWYVITDRSVRIRRGIWIIRETTLTFENIQNVTVRQGPLQRYFGIANVYIETAGGGSSAAGAHGGSSMNLHQGVIEGIADAPRIRDLILSRLRISPGAGLGDEPLSSPAAATPWTADHLALLREIRDTAQSLTTSC